MDIFGLDFTSAPRKRKPITCAHAVLDKDVLTFQSVEHFTTFAQFEAFLRREGAWVAGCDFPFGQPRLLVENLDWPRTWAEYVRYLAGLTMKEFEQMLRDYRDSREPGDKHHYRKVDASVGALSPMLLYRIPIGRMFFRGAPRLLEAPVSVLPCYPTEDDGIVLEAYPAVVARRWLGRQSYKSDRKDKQTTEQADNRRHLVAGLRSDELKDIYGVRVHMTDEQADDIVEDPGADDLDALLCAVQAAWAATQPNYGIPPDSDPLEGWIVDPDARHA